MSEFKAKHHALQILQRLASGERAKGSSSSGDQRSSPRKPGVKSSEDILREKYTELAELMAVQRLEKHAVSALQKMYVTPPKGERRSKRRTKDKEGGRRRRRVRGNGDGSEVKGQRPQSASSTSSHSSYSSARSYSSSVSTASHASATSDRSKASVSSQGSRTSSRSTASRSSTRSSTKSTSSRSSTRSEPKPVERHFVTIVEEEEVEEVINQDEVEDRQLVQFDAELAKETEEEARLKKEASKRTRRVSFVLEAQEESSSDEESDHTIVGEEEQAFEEEEDFSEKYANETKERVESEPTGDPTPRYIEIENSLLREILSPRSPRRFTNLSPRSEKSSPPKQRSKSPKRNARSPSPKRAWEMSNTIPLPMKPQKDIHPSDHRLSNTDNPEIKKWLRHKNALIRRQRKEERMKEREEKRAEEYAELKRTNRLAEAGETYDVWRKQKVKDLRQQRRNIRLITKEEKRRDEEERVQREELFKEKQRLSVSAFGEKVPSPRVKKKKRKSRSVKEEEQTESNSKSKEPDSGAQGNRKFPSSNPFKGLSYDDWMRQKMTQEENRRKQEREIRRTDPDLETVIPNIAKNRIDRAKSGKGKRVDSGPWQEKNSTPERYHRTEKQEAATRPYTWAKNNMDTSASSGAPSSRGGPKERVGLRRPSSARNRLHDNQNRSPRRVFSPSSARPEPQGSESNDDPSEAGKTGIGKAADGKIGRQNFKDRNNNDCHGDELFSKALVEHPNPTRNVADAKDSAIFLTEFDQ